MYLFLVELPPDTVGKLGITLNPQDGEEFSWANLSPAKCLLVRIADCDSQSSLRWYCTQYSGMEAMGWLWCTASGGGEFVSKNKGSNEGFFHFGASCFWVFVRISAPVNCFAKGHHCDMTLFSCSVSRTWLDVSNHVDE